MQDFNTSQKNNETLTIKHILGYNTDFKNNIFLHPKDQQIIYPAANVIVVNNENKQQSFHHCHNGTNGITAMTQSKDKRYLAWAEEAAQPIIVVLDQKSEYAKKKTFMAKDNKSNQYISLNFCPPSEGDGKIRYFIALSGPPEYMLFHFAIDKPRCIGFVNIMKQSIEQYRFSNCFYHPKEDDFVVVLGVGQIKTYKLSHDQPPRSVASQPIKKDNKDTQHSPNYQAYCLLTDGSGTMIVGTDMGELLVFNNNCELKMILPDSPKLEQFSIQVIIPYSKGFLVGGQDCTILIYEKNEGDHKKPYTHDKKIQCRDYRYSVNSLLLADDKESNLIIGLENNQMLQVPFNSERVISEDNLKFEHQVLPFHSQEITGMDICIRKALVGTCSLDKSVRIWNYQEHTLENMKEFEEEAYALAFHPSGFHIIVAFRAKIRIMNLFEHDIVPFREIPAQNCQEIMFSNGGNLFAFNNQSMVQIYNFYTGDQATNLSISILRGTGKVKAIFIEDDDLSIYTGNSDGVVKFWKLDEQGRQPDELLKISDFDISGICAISETKLGQEYRRICYVAGTHRNGIENQEKCIYEIKIVLKFDRDQLEKNKKVYIISEPTKIFTETTVSRVCLLNSGKLFFFATDEKNTPGSVRASPYYFDKNKDVYEIQSHKKGITRIQASFDDNYLFTSSRDSSLIIYEIKDKDAKIRLDKEGIGMQFSEDFLMPQDEYNEQQREIEQLIAERTEKEFTQKQLQQEIQRNTERKVNELRQQKDESDDYERNRMDLLEHERRKLEKNNEERKKKLKENHEYQKKMIENDYKKKIAMEMTRNEELQKEVEREKIKFETEERDIKNNHHYSINDRRRMFEQQKQEYETQCKQLYKQQDHMDSEFTEKLKDLEQRAEEDIETIKELNEEKMKQLFQELDTNDIEKKAKQSQYEQEASKLEEERSKLKEILEQINTLTEQNKSSQKIKEGQLKEIQERDKTIHDKQKRIYELKKKTQELEKFKFVLDYKIKELKRDIGPKEEEIAKMKEQIANMRSEIVLFRRNNANLCLIVTDLKLRQKGMRKEIENLTESEKQNSVYINNYKQDVNDCHSEVHDYKKLKQQCLKLYNKYVQEDSKKIYEGSDKQKDFIKERAHLETSVNGLKLKFTKNLIVHEQDNKRIMDQNVDLIREINDLKREKKFLNEEKQREKLIKSKHNVNQESKKLNQDIDELVQERDELIKTLEEQQNINTYYKNQIQQQQQGEYVQNQEQELQQNMMEQQQYEQQYYQQEDQNEQIQQDQYEQQQDEQQENMYNNGQQGTEEEEQQQLEQQEIQEQEDDGQFEGQEDQDQQQDQDLEQEGENQEEQQ